MPGYIDPRRIVTPHRVHVAATLAQPHVPAGERRHARSTIVINGYSADSLSQYRPQRSAISSGADGPPPPAHA